MKFVIAALIAVVIAAEEGDGEKDGDGKKGGKGKWCGGECKEGECCGWAKPAKADKEEETPEEEGGEDDDKPAPECKPKDTAPWTEENEDGEEV